MSEGDLYRSFYSCLPTLPTTIRAIHDSLCVVKRVLESGKVVAGGGAVEAGLSVHLEGFATTLGSREQLAINEFANACLVIPKASSIQMY